MPPRPGPRYPLVLLGSRHDVQHFTSGRHPGAREIDEYLRTSALTEQAAGLSSVWIATDPQSAATEGGIAGYFTLSPISVPLSPAVLVRLDLESVPYRAVGGYLLGRLGVSAALQGRKLGSTLVAAAIAKAKDARGEAGGAFLAVDPKNEKLLDWYQSLDFGFCRLNPDDASKRRLIVKL
jgi:ribosomal protein S18 acetylase RimI-like enzyme